MAMAQKLVLAFVLLLTASALDANSTKMAKARAEQGPNAARPNLKDSDDSDRIGEVEAEKKDETTMEKPQTSNFAFSCTNRYLTPYSYCHEKIWYQCCLHRLLVQPCHIRSCPNVCVDADQNGQAECQ
eukprot:TRINITY_DN115111_c0_g1_i1.p1 TRINITY_DN115111_c0_g1~~TRINITY_DN115111_c0_g1_i1.p1  ORF type:complete len:128 (+),score=20.08 TRINITY_DN115111_c0_g1_i1:89-472(+)